jgi:hypothetical protein
MIAMTMLPDMVVCVWCGVGGLEAVEEVEVGTRVESVVMGLWLFMRVVFFFCVDVFGRVELES